MQGYPRSRIPLPRKVRHRGGVRKTFPVKRERSSSSASRVRISSTRVCSAVYLCYVYNSEVRDYVLEYFSTIVDK